MDITIEKINKFLNGLATGSVVGLDGYSGIGKTTISNELEKINNRIKVFHLDDYIVTSNTKENLEPQINSNTKELKLEWTSVDGKGFESLVEDIEKYRDKIVLVEGVFFSHPDILPNIFDTLIFIDGDEELADRRRVKREKKRWGDKYFPETHPDSFARLFKLAWGKYKTLYKPKENADLIIE